MKVALYARVSTIDKDQNPEVQLDRLRKYCQDMEWEVYQEYVDYAPAGYLVGRRSWTRLMKDASLHKFDILLVWKLDRAFRSVIHAANTMNILRNYHIGFRSFMESSIDTTTPHGEFIFNILAAVAELERQNIAQRVKEGLSYAAKHGTKSGRPIGRKSYNIPFTIICKALERVNNSDGKGWSEAARLITEETGIKVSPAFVMVRMQRETALQNPIAKMGGK